MLYCAFHKHANSKVQKPPWQLRFSLPSIIITITSNEPWNTETHKTDRNPPITNHKPWLFEPVKVKFCFLRGPLRWLTAAKNAIVSWLLNFRIRMFVKSAVNGRLCQEGLLRSRNFATVVTWRYCCSGNGLALLFREDSRERTRPDLTEQRKLGLSFAAFFLNKRPESKEGEICMFTHVARTPLVASHISSEANGRSLHASYSC